MKDIDLTLSLSPEGAAGLRRFVEKVSHDDAMAVLYPHVDRDLRNERASQIIAAFSVLEQALKDAKVTSWPWIETGKVGR